ncbi:hypothetical protein NIES3974_26610 [Calothrix sp. NIES-3974]|nr:hypothetical protein NIES3974_26610 [Calothrix sp. NIES-3974]
MKIHGHNIKKLSQIHLAPGSQVTIPDLNWSEFESLLQEMGQKLLEVDSRNYGSSP